MYELANHLESQYRGLFTQWRMTEKKPNVILMHSSLDERTYRHALDAPEEDEWKAATAKGLLHRTGKIPLESR